MTKHKKTEASNVGLKIFSSALLLQGMASAAPAYARDFVGHHGQHQGRGNRGDDAVAAAAGHRGGGWGQNTVSHFGLDKLERPMHVRLDDLTRPRHLPRMANTTLPLVGGSPISSIGGSIPTDTNRSIDLDLSSSNQSITIKSGMIKNGSEVTIQVGNSTKTIHAGDKVTAAEFVSFEQAQTKGGQSLVVDDNGRASGGTLSLSKLTSDKLNLNIDDVVIPQNVTSHDRISERADIDITGNLINYGMLNETVKGKTGSANFAAHDIINQSGGLITTASKRDTSVDLNFVASGEFENSGEILSSGSIDIRAAKGISNNRNETSANVVQGMITAENNVSLHSGTVTNSGVITARNGNLSIDAPNIVVPSTTTSNALSTITSTITSQTLTVDNHDGVLSAINGDIVIRQANYNGTSDSTVTGGNLLSRRLVLNSGQGTIDVDVNRLTGEVVSTGNAVHVNAATDTLLIGKQCLVGDPTFYNSTGAIAIIGDISVGQELAIIAAGSITATNAVSSITARNGSGDGFDISLIAGVNVTGTGGDTGGVPPGTPATGTVTFTGVSATGGDVDLSLANSALTINSNANAGNNSGGNVLIAAYSVGIVGGRVLLPAGSTINASGDGPGADGNVTIIGSGPLAGLSTVNVGTITGANNVTVMQATPVFSSGASMTFGTTGAITSGNTLVGNYSQLSPADITISGPIDAGGTVQIAGGGTITMGAVTVGGNFPGTMQVIAQGTITLNGNLTNPAGMLIVSGEDIVSSNASLVLSTTANTLSFGKTGDVTLIAGAAFTADATGATITGGSAKGGSISLATGVSGAINTINTGLGGGGSVTLAAFDGSDATSGTIALPTSITTSAGSSVGSNGDVTIVAEEAGPGTAITFGDITTNGFAVASSAGGDVNIYNASPGLLPVVVTSGGTVSSGSFLGGALQQADIIGDDITALGRSIKIGTNNNVQLGDINASAQASFSDGGLVDITAHGTAALTTGSAGTNSINLIDVHGGIAGTGAAGALTLFSNSGINIGNGSLNLSTTGGAGANVTFDANLGTIAFNTNSFSVNGAGNGPGGLLTLRAQQVTGPFPLTFSADGAGVNAGGSISLVFTGTGTVSIDPSNIILNARSGTSAGAGGNVFIDAQTKTLQIDGSAIDVSARAFGGDGGLISIVAGSIVASGSGPIQLSANGNATGDGGTISITQFSGGALTVGSGAGQLLLSATGGDLGGQISVFANGDLTVDPAAASANPTSGNATGASYSFNAGQFGPGNLLITGDLSANGNGTGIGGQISLNSNSTTDFAVGAKKGINGILGLLSVIGAANGSIAVRNNGGGVIISQNISNVDFLTLRADGPTGNITLGADLVNINDLVILTTATVGDITGKKLISAPNISMTATNGAIGGKKALNLETSSLAMQAQNQINVSNSSPVTLSLNSISSSGSSVKVASAGDISVDLSVTAGTTVSLSSKGTNPIISLGALITAGDSITLDTGKKTVGTIERTVIGAELSAPTVTLNAGSGQVGDNVIPINVATNNLSVQALGDVNILNTSSVLNLNSANSAGTFKLTSNNGTINVNTAFKSTGSINLIGITSAGITLNSSIGGKSTDAIILNSDGVLAQASTKITSTANNFLTIIGGAQVGSAAIPIKTAAPNVTISGIGASSNVSSVLKKGTVAFDGNSAGDVVITSSGATRLDNIAANSLSVTMPGGLLNVNDSVTVQTVGGDLTLNNLGKGKGSTISVGAGSTVQTVNGDILISNLGTGSDSTISLAANTTVQTTTNGSITINTLGTGIDSMISLGANSTIKTMAGVPGDGVIQFVVGALPPPETNTTPSPNVIPHLNGTGVIFFNDGVTANGAPSNVTATNTKVIFSAAGLGAGAIVLDGNVTIDADPPATPVSAALVASTPSSGEVVINPPTTAPSGSITLVSGFDFVASGGMTTTGSNAMTLGSTPPSASTDPYSIYVGGNVLGSASSINTSANISLFNTSVIQARGNTGGGAHRHEHEPRTHERMTHNDPFNFASAASFDLDLSEAHPTIQVEAGMIKRGTSIEIEVGGTTKTVHQGDTITAAEFVALQQTQGKGGQSLQLDAAGRATGGSFSLGSLTSGLGMHVDDVVVPQNVNVNDRVSSRSAIELSGSLLNYGTISETGKGRNSVAAFSASTITNASGATITTVGRGNSAIDLSLTTSGDFSNSGTISSSGSLDIRSGGSLTNNAGSISAAQNVSLHSNNVTNSGHVVATAGNVSIDAPSLVVPLSDIPPNAHSAVQLVSQELTINNANGSIEALNGDIVIREASYNGTSNSSVTGGDLLSQRLVLNSGQGNIDVNVNQLTGEVVSSGNAVHVSAATDTLVIGNQCLVGDPTFYNSLGSTIINGDISVGEALAIVTAGSLTATNALTSITARDGAGDGYDITIIAGVDVTGTGGNSPLLPAGTPATGTVSFTGVSATGGDVDLTGASAALTINSNANANNNSGGNVLIAAYSTAGGVGGRVLLPTGSTINVAGDGTGASGNVTIISSGRVAGVNGLTMGAVVGADNVTVMQATPVFTSGTSMTFNTVGAISSGNSITGSYSNLEVGNLVIGSIGASGFVQIAGGGNVSMSTVGASVLQVASNKDITLNGNLAPRDGVLMVSGGDIVNNLPGLNIDTTSGNPSAGFVTLIAGALFTASPTGATIQGASPTGGNVDLTNATAIFASHATSDGGTVTVLAFDGSDATSGRVVVPSITTSGSNAGGTNGNVAIFAGESTVGANAITFGDIFTTASAVTQLLGDVVLVCADPSATAGSPISASSNGVITTGLVSGGTIQATNISGNDITARGRTINIQSGRNVQLGDIDASALDTTLDAGFVTVAAPGSGALTVGQVTSNSILSINISGGSTSGNAGSLIMSSNSGINILVGGLNNTVVDGVGASIDLDASGSNIILPSNNFSVNGAGPDGQGGALTLRAQQIATFNPTTLSADGSGTGSGGTVSLIFTGNVIPVSIDTGTFIVTARSGANGGNGGEVDIVADNIVLSVDGGAIDVNPQGTDGKGGDIFIEAAAITAFGSNTLQLNANGVGNGDGGTILLRQLGVGPMTIGHGNSQIELNATGGSNAGGGGSISVEVNGSLTVNATALQFNTAATDGNGGIVSLQAGTSSPGDLFITGNLNASGNGNGLGGSISLVSNSTNDFQVGSKKAINGITGLLSVFGTPTNGDILIRNNGGGIVVSQEITEVDVFDLIADGATGNITLGAAIGGSSTNIVDIATNATAGNITGKKLISANSVFLSALNGAVGGKKALSLSTDEVTLFGKNQVNVKNNTANLVLDAVQSNTSSVTITTAGSAVITANEVAGTDFNLVSTGTNSFINLGVSASVTAGQSITLDTGKGVGNILCDVGGTGAFVAPTINLFAGAGNVGDNPNFFFVQTDNLSVHATGNVLIANAVRPINLNFADAQGQFELHSDQPITVNTSFKSAGSITLQGDFGAGVNLNTSIGGKNTDAIVLFGGDITPASTKVKVTANSFLTIQADDIGTAAIPLVTVVPDISILSGEDVNVFSASKKTPLNFTANNNSGDLTLSTSGPTTLQDITAKSISVTQSGGRLLVDVARTLTATDGGIVLNNIGKGKGSNIEFGGGSKLFSDATTPSDGEIDIVMGPLTTPLPENNTSNANVLTFLVGTGQIFFNEGITANGATSTITATNTKVIFDAGGFGAGSIILDGGATFDADPPSGAITTAAITADQSVHRDRVQMPALNLSAPANPGIMNAITSIAPEISFTNERLSTLNSMGGLTPTGLQTGTSSSTNDIGFLTMQPAVVSSGNQFQPGWISETEIETGEIPASFAMKATGSDNVLNSGAILSASPENRKIETPLGTVNIAANSVALVMSFRDGVAIYNLHDNNRNSVTIRNGDRIVSVSPGQSIVLTNRANASLADINPAQLIAHRSLRERQLGNGVKMFHSEFSVPAALAYVMPIKTLMKSKHPHAVRTANRMLKTASVLMQLQSGGEDFRQHRKPQVTAYKN